MQSDFESNSEQLFKIFLLFTERKFSLDLIDSITFSGEFIFNARCETGHKWMWKKGNDYRTSLFLLKN